MSTRDTVLAVFNLRVQQKYRTLMSSDQLRKPKARKEATYSAKDSQTVIEPLCLVYFDAFWVQAPFGGTSLH